MFDRITSDSAILGGKPIIRGSRISVAMIFEWIASGADRDTILRKHPQLTALPDTMKVASLLLEDSFIFVFQEEQQCQ